MRQAWTDRSNPGTGVWGLRGDQGPWREGATVSESGAEGHRRPRQLQAPGCGQQSGPRKRGEARVPGIQEMSFRCPVCHRLGGGCVPEMAGSHYLTRSSCLGIKSGIPAGPFRGAAWRPGSQTATGVAAGRSPPDPRTDPTHASLQTRHPATGGGGPGEAEGSADNVAARF